MRVEPPGYQNLMVYDAETTRAFTRERASLELDNEGLVSSLTNSRVERVRGLRRPRDRFEEGVFTGITLHTDKGVAHIGVYLTQSDDAGTCLVGTNQLHESIESYEIDTGGS